MEGWLLAANQGDLELQWRLGLAFWEGSSGVLKDEQQAAKWFSEAAQAGHPSSQWMIGKCYAQGEGVQQNWEEAARWRRRAMTQGHTDAMWELVRQLCTEGKPVGALKALAQNYKQCYGWKATSKTGYTNSSDLKNSPFLQPEYD